MTRTCLLVVAKAPVAGLAKTRLAAAVGARHAARIAAASLLDTIDAVLATPDTVAVVAMTGAPAAAERADELAAALARCTVVSQHGTDFATRLANAHTAAAGLGAPVLQIGMDTPQLTPALLAASAAALHAPGTGAVLGPATDGGWWALGLRRPGPARVLRGIPMSRPDTGARTGNALRHAGLTVTALPELSDVDTMADALRVAAVAPAGRFAAAVADAMRQAVS
jgi:glycosyltransferase A (GT-A) superfamily protein (DUF2064 family)